MQKMEYVGRRFLQWQAPQITFYQWSYLSLAGGKLQKQSSRRSTNNFKMLIKHYDTPTSVQQVMWNFQWKFELNTTLYHI